MTTLFEKLDAKKRKDIKALTDFIEIYCRENHGAEVGEPFVFRDDRLHDILRDRNLELCAECSKLLNHGIAKLLLCPYDPKPTCKKCETHCYAPDYRRRIREVMRFSGMYLVKRGRVDLLAHYLM